MATMSFTIILFIFMQSAHSSYGQNNAMCPKNVTCDPKDSIMCQTDRHCGPYETCCFGSSRYLCCTENKKFEEERTKSAKEAEVAQKKMVEAAKEASKAILKQSFAGLNIKDENATTESSNEQKSLFDFILK